ncbi:MAG: ABC transporter permease subunit [Pseudomonadota bacterium]
MNGASRAHRPGKTLTSISNHVILLLGVAFMCGPVAYAFWTTIAPGAVDASDWRVVEATERFATVYGRLLSDQPVFVGMPTARNMLWTSLVMGFGFAAITTATSFFAAYALVYFHLRFAGIILLAIVVTLYFPVETRIMPTFLVADALGLLNTYAGLILPLTATGLATLLFTMTLRQMPDELTEAAMLDGAGPPKFFIDVLFPIQLPTIAAIFAVLFAVGWNQYLWPMIMATNNQGLSTVVRGIGQLGGAGPYAVALGIIATLPPAIIGGLGLFVIKRGLVFEAR